MTDIRQPLYGTATVEVAARLAAAPKPPLFRSPDHRIWFLSRTHVDITGTEWAWDQHEFDDVTGPEMVSPSHPFLHLPLLGLAAHCGLHSDTTAAFEAGELVFQLHDAAEAGYTPTALEA
ncbi:hypothetical protein [Streptomyces sp. NPDC050534]|uniref:hypothetical protein n=1 Tax=Streptomyces sp. NPDC050534 TaxID=3365625 RepID=UPI0037B898F8